MINNLIHSFIDSQQTLLNERLNENIKLNLVRSANFERLPASDKYINYELFIESIDTMNNESGICEIVAKMNFIFQFTDRNQETYKKTFDKYVFEIFRMFNSYPGGFVNYGITDNIYLLSISNVTLNSGDLFEGDYFRPAITITFRSLIPARGESLITENIGT